jgi:hypothetical protein
MEDDPLNKMEDDYFANNRLIAYYIYVGEIYFKQRYLCIFFYLQ